VTVCTRNLQPVIRIECHAHAETRFRGQGRTDSCGILDGILDGIRDLAVTSCRSPTGDRHQYIPANGERSPAARDQDIAARNQE